MKKIAFTASIVMNIVTACILGWAALGGAVWLFVTFAVNPQHEQNVTLYELLDIQPGDTVFLGDSITYGGRWNELFPDTATRQRGIGGDTSAGVLARLDPIANAKPKQLFLKIGTNDIFFGVPQDDIVTNVTRIVDRVLEASPDTEVFVQSVLPRAAGYQQRVESLNAALEEAVEGKTTWINLYPLFLDEAGSSIDDSLSNDELHLLGPGYIIWRDAIAPHVAKRTSAP